jgi:sulfite exporter TauE/SafE
MCAPLTCALGPWKANADQRLGFTTAYHLTRTLAYAACGALAGFLGAKFGRWMALPLMDLLPAAMVIFLIALALGLDRGFAAPAFLRSRHARWMQLTQNRSPAFAGALLGALSPLLPCGPLHALFGLALLSGHALRGAEIGLGFALGTIPLLWAAQMGYHRLSLRLGEARSIRLRRGLAGVAALALLTKLIWFNSPGNVCL